jgi:acyl-CoA synthetase (NDP forming)
LASSSKAKSSTTFDRIFNPKRIAVLGVNAQGFGFGRGILDSLITIGFSGEIFPVNPKGGEVFGLTIRKSLDDVPGDIDFAIIATPAQAVPAALEHCRLKGAAGAEILSAGFKELGTPEGIALEAELKAIAAKGIRVIGPNCFGIYAPQSGLTLLPGPRLSRDPGGISFISQSGGLAIDLAHMGMWKGIRFNKVVSIGNGVDLRETELLEYFGDDDETTVIGMYIEGIDDGRRFFDVLRTVGSKKPVIIIKGGLSDAGQRAVMSHTASMGGNRAIWNSALRQCNAIQASDLFELADACLACTMLDRRRYRGISLIGGGGALGVAAADIAEQYGLSIPALATDLQEKIRAILPQPGSSATNPIDVANPYVPPANLKEVLTLAARDPNVDIQILVQLLYHYTALGNLLKLPSIQGIVPYRELADDVSEAIDTSGKPIALVLPNPKRDLNSLEIEEVIRKARQEFIQRNIPVFDDLKDALRAIQHVAQYCLKREAN